MHDTDKRTSVPGETCTHTAGFKRARQSGARRDPSHLRQERPVQTLARAYSAILAGQDPWVALNEFFHEWFDYARDQRAALVAEPIEALPVMDSGDLWRWAVFCAAVADYLCTHDDISRPSWVDDPIYTLSAPWYGFGDPGATTPQVRAHLERVTPEPLRRRNILGGNRVFANKYEKG